MGPVAADGEAAGGGEAAAAVGAEGLPPAGGAGGACACENSVSAGASGEESGPPVVSEVGAA